MGAMSNDHGQQLPNPSAIPVSRQRIPRLSTPTSSHSHERGKSSTAGGSSPHDVSITSSNGAHSSGRDIPHQRGSGSKIPDHKRIEAQRKRRSTKPRSSGGFLLSNVLSNDPSKANQTSRHDGRRASRIPVGSKGKSPQNTPEKTYESPATTGLGLGIGGQDALSDNGSSPSHLSADDVLGDDGRSRRRNRPTRIPSPSPRPASSLDVDSAQIVNMALNLSESRRIASRRHVSSPIPPRLTPVPDGSHGGTLKQHLQQQRRTSRTISPKPDQGYIIRNVSGHRLNSPLQATFDPEGTYTYHFSSSTLDRAQKAKEHLELMAQYRRLLLFLPPLKPDALSRSRPSTSDPPTSPTASKSSSNTHVTLQQSLGRPYNPLQYIRNRKVRARERKTIDGETLGFDEVMKVTEWVDETAASVVHSPSSPGGSSLPSFPGAQSLEGDHATPSNIPRPTSALGKPKRPRIDWSINPADMLADAYWLEQDDNKHLIEDRHYSKIFPSKQESLRPSSGQTNEPGKSAFGTSTDPRTSEEKNLRLSSQFDSARPMKGENGTRDRARQKLHELRGTHRHGHSIHPHDFLKLRKGSLSDSSDNDSDRKRRDRRDRSGTLSANDTDLLNKQMMEMLAKEASEEQKEQSSDVGNKELKALPGSMVTPDRVPQRLSTIRSPKESSPGLIEGQERLSRAQERQGSPLRSGRPSLEVPAHNYRPSLDLDSSVPASPDLGPSRTASSYLPTIGMDLSPPSSRPGSPVRKPFSKVKHIFRDRSRERAGGHERETKPAPPIEKEKKAESPVEEPMLLPPVPAERPQSLDIPRSKSPGPYIVPRATNQSHKSHRSVGSIRFKSDEALGLRSIFKGGAKIDGIIREGVSKVGDFIWRKDSERDDTSSTTSTDESNSEQKPDKSTDATTKGQQGGNRQSESRRPKHYMDTLPPFKSVLETTDESPVASDNNMLSTQNPISRAASPRPERFDKLKLRIDVGGRSAHSSPPSIIVPSSSSKQRDHAEFSESELRSRDDASRLDRSRQVSRDLNTALLAPAASAKRDSTATALSLKSRQWSISDRSSASPHRAQVSKREVARIRALILSSGIKAMEIARRAQEPQPLFAPTTAATLNTTSMVDINYNDNNDQNKAMVLVPAGGAATNETGTTGTGLTWPDVQGLIGMLDSKKSPAAFPPSNYAALTSRQIDLFPTTARVLEQSIDRSLTTLQTSTSEFVGETSPSSPNSAAAAAGGKVSSALVLHHRTDALRTRLAADLSERARRCADDADDVGRDLLDARRLEVKRVTDAMDKMLRRRRRRFRWARRAGWLALEYMLVGLMWYVWFIVVVCRVFVGLGRGLWGGVRWLFWL